MRESGDPKFIPRRIPIGALFGILVVTGVALASALYSSVTLYHLLTTLITVGIAFAVAGFCLLIQPIAKWQTLNILGVGTVASGLVMIGSALSQMGPSAFAISHLKYPAIFWWIIFLIESATLLGSAYYVGRKSPASFIMWMFILAFSAPCFGALAVSPASLNFTQQNGLSLLGYGIVGLIFVNILSGIAITTHNNFTKRVGSAWGLGMTVAGTLLLISLVLILPDPFGSSWTSLLGHLTHMLAYIALFLLVLSNIAYNPVDTIFHELADERMRFAEWDRVSLPLLDFSEQAAMASTYDALFDIAFESCDASFKLSGFALYLWDGISDRPLAIKEPLSYPNDPENYAEILEQALRFMRQRPQDNQDVIRYAHALFGEQHRVACHRLIAGDKTIGFHLSSRHVDQPYISTDMLTRFFDKYSAILALTLQKIKIETQHNLLAEEEHHISETLQNAMRPRLRPLPNALSAGRLVPASGLARIGGDFFDAFSNDGRTVYFVVGDISGHGVEAAPHNSFIRASIKAIASTGVAPAGIMEITNNLIVSDLPDDSYVTALCGSLDTVSGHCEVCIAGHPKPLIVNNGVLRTVEVVRNPFLGFIPNLHYRSYTFTLEPHEALILYTDGITEARNSKGELFGLNRLIEVVTAHQGATPDVTLGRLYAAIEKFTGFTPPNDDRATLIIQRLSVGAPTLCESPTTETI